MDCIKTFIARTVPLARLMETQIASLREWARGRAREASARPKMSPPVTEGQPDKLKLPPTRPSAPEGPSRPHDIPKRGRDHAPVAARHGVSRRILRTCFLLKDALRPEWGIVVSYGGQCQSEELLNLRRNRALSRFELGSRACQNRENFIIIRKIVFR